MPDRAVPRWSPGAEWVELATARYWARPEQGGERVLVRTWGRDAAGYTDEPVLLSGLLTDHHGSVADKHHRLYQFAQSGTLHSEPVGPDHPAERYRRYHDTVADRFDRAITLAQDAVDYPPRYRTLLLCPDVELRPDGRSWVCSARLALSPRPENYWWDLARATDVLASVAREYQVPVVLLRHDNPHRVIDPLWHHGWTELTGHTGSPSHCHAAVG